MPNGGRRRRQVYGRTREEVGRKIAALVTQAASGVPAAETSWTVTSYVAHWREHIAPGSLRPATLANYLYVLDSHVLPEVGKVRLARLTPAHVRRMLGALDDKGLSPRTQQLAHAVLRSVLAHAVRDELVHRNVVALVRPPRPERLEVQPWTPAEAGQFLASVRGHRMYALFAVGLALGLRRGELLALTWADVDLTGKQLTVRRSVQRLRDGSGLVFGPPKSARSRRSIPLPAVCVDALRAHKAAQSAERLAAGGYWTDLDLVFPTSIGTVFEPRNLNRLFAELVEAAGLRRIRVHDMRHTCASLLLAQGVPPRVVMEILGHSQISITMETYAHVMPTAMRDAADAVDAVLGSRA
ncbi:MAG: site-specific integrase [Actinobacteria bacterium]|nr:site-specific integrase [Actinomycetota bacterium]